MPWLGYFDKMDRSDVFVLLDNVQYKKREYQNRNRIKTSQGWAWITVPVLEKSSWKINEVLINDTFEWRKRHLHALELNYGKSLYFGNYINLFREFYLKEWRVLSDVNRAGVMLLKDILGISSEVVRASDMEGLREEPTLRLIDICRKVGADTYLSGRDGRNYMNMELFEEAGIRVLFQDFRHPVYPQLFGGFEYFMSVVDLLFNCGGDSIEVIRRGNRE